MKTVALALLLALAPGCYRHGGALLGAVIGYSIITAAIVSAHPPPPPYVVEAPPPRAGYVWQPGYWALDDEDRWVWVQGHWVARYPGYDWEPSRWVEDPDGHWRLMTGHWIAIPPPPPRP